MRRRGRIDRNHGEIVDALRRVGASVQSLSDIGDGCPDILVGFRLRNYLLEIKDGMGKPSRRRLTPDEVDWHQNWHGDVDVVESIDEALHAIGVLE